MNRVEKELSNYISLGNFPTPIEENVFFKEKFGIDFFLKRDDCCGFFATGTKLRKLEYILKNSLENGVSDIISIGQVQSNQSRLLSFLAPKLGFNLHLLTKGATQEKNDLFPGNTFLNVLFGARIHFLEEKEWRFFPLKVKKLQKKLRKENKNPQFISLGATEPEGIFGIIKLVREIIFQNSGIFPYSHVIIPVGTGSTLAGFDIGLNLAKKQYKKIKTRILGFSLHADLKNLKEEIKGHFQSFNDKFEYSFVPSKNVELFDRYRGKGYGQLSTAEIEKLVQISREFKLYLDPYYLLKPFLGTIDLINKKEIDHDAKILFLVSGAPFNFFPLKEQLIQELNKR
ncbi:1-aminocyclopropane-1-carboxylate deaminase/D-cysteine desulfhydrase [Candidatus Riflebacteria bacterium]